MGYFKKRETWIFDKKIYQKPLKLRHDSKMFFGKYKGEMLIDVPAKYLIWLYEGDKLKDINLILYIKHYYDELMDEVNMIKKRKL